MKIYHGNYDKVEFENILQRSKLIMIMDDVITFYL